MDENVQMLSVKRVAEMMDVSPMLIYRTIDRGDLPAVRIGRTLRVRSEDLNTYLQRNTTGGCPACDMYDSVVRTLREENAQLYDRLDRLESAPTDE